MSQTPIKAGSQAKTSILDLPTELVVDIFHYACCLSTSFSSALCQLSTWTRKIALPYLFLTVIIKKLGNKQGFTKVLNQGPSHPSTPDFKPKDYVESLWLEAVSNRTLSIFRACDNLVNLALPVDNLMWLVYSSSPAMHTLSPLSPRAITRKKDLHLLILNAKKPNWSLREAVNNDPTLTSPFFAKVTHLRIGLVGPYITHLELAHFTRLTHIAIPYHQPEYQNLSDLLRVFDFPSTICLVVVLLTDMLYDTQYQEAVDWVKRTRVTNPKVYVVTSRQPDLQSEWEEEARHGLSIWDKAERFTHVLLS
ncbi:hypothetical protein CPB84DRAFT_564819 [Gymnopilus junonius]|uniref:F-box domain-containing protein n=1 Tax=Gymnopilus junonius TaxID=109634 RepID=A0A9P5NVP4_GYMJU|nr:hypothetical protein CPB84DRAFT_564819 [Gymnopilus junonius]